jgi:hypothetical protein
VYVYNRRPKKKSVHRYFSRLFPLELNGAKIFGFVILMIHVLRDLWTGFIWLRIGTSSCEHDNEPSGSIKGRKFLD